MGMRVDQAGNDSSPAEVDHLRSGGPVARVQRHDASVLDQHRRCRAATIVHRHDVRIGDEEPVLHEIFPSRAGRRVVV